MGMVDEHVKLEGSPLSVLSVMSAVVPHRQKKSRTAHGSLVSHFSSLFQLAVLGGVVGVINGDNTTRQPES